MKFSRNPTLILPAAFLATTGTGALAFVLPLLSLEDRISGTWLGSAFALYFLARLLVSPLGGAWADHSGSRHPFLAACLLGLAGPLLYFIQPGQSTLLVVQLLLGMAAGLARPALMTGIAVTVPTDQRGRWLAGFSMAGNGGLLAGPILGGLLYMNGTLEPVLLGLGVCLGLAAILGVFLPGHPASATPDTTPDTASEAEAKPLSRFLPILTAIAGRTLGIGAFTAFYPLLLASHLAAAPPTLALVYSVTAMTTLLALAGTGRLLTNRNLSRMTLMGMVLSGAALLGLGLAGTLWQFLALGTLMGLGAALSMPASMTLSAGLSDRPGKLLGTASGAAGLGFLMGPILGGLALHWSGNIGSALVIPAIAGCAALLPLLLAELGTRPGWSRAYSALAGTALLTALAVLTLTLATPSNTQDHLFQFTDTAMGTVVRITLDEPGRAKTRQAAEEAMDLIRRLQRDLDHRSASGSIGRVNANAGKRPVTVTPRALELITRSLEYARLSDGAFDPTIGAVTTLPFFFALDPSVAESRQPLVNWEEVEIRDSSVFLKRQGMALDLGGIGKGAIIDAAANLLRERGITAAMVEAGGDFICFGPRDWTIGVQSPREIDEPVMETLVIRNEALCTSGDYQRFVGLDTDSQTRRHHILNPRTMGSASRSIAVSVLAPTAQEADALATTLFVLGPKHGAAYLRDHAIRAKAQWVTPELELISSPGFPE